MQLPKLLAYTVLSIAFHDIKSHSQTSNLLLDTQLQRNCREVGIYRWPYQKLAEVDSMKASNFDISLKNLLPETLPGFRPVDVNALAEEEIVMEDEDSLLAGSEIEFEASSERDLIWGSLMNARDDMQQDTFIRLPPLLRTPILGRKSPLLLLEPDVNQICSNENTEPDFFLSAITQNFHVDSR